MSQSPDPPNGAAASATAPTLPGAAPLIRGESARSYHELLTRICATLQPRDPLEEIWVRDIVDLVWETFRLRRAKAWLVTGATQDKLELDLRFDAKISDRNASQMARKWAAGDENAASEVEGALASADLSTDRMLAGGLSSTLDTMERLDRLLLGLEGRRSAALRELDRHRAPLAQKLRCAIADAEEAELVPDAPRIAPPQPA